MNFPLVVVRAGRRRIEPAGVAVLLAVCLVSFVALPTAYFWFTFHDANLVSNALTFGWCGACFFFTSLLMRAYKASVEKAADDTTGLGELLATGGRPERPCPVCGGSSYLWGNVTAQGLHFQADGASRLRRFFRFGTQMPARRCDGCGNVQLFTRPGWTES